MDLFKIERYEEDSLSAEDNAEKECKNLAQLLEQARGRKRSRELSLSNKQENEDTAGLSSREGTFVLQASCKVKKNDKKKKRKEKRTKLEHKRITLEQSVENINEGEYESNTRHTTEIVEEEHRTVKTSRDDASDDASDVGSKDCSKADAVIVTEDIKDVKSNENIKYSDQALIEALDKVTVKPQTEVTIIGGKNKKQKPNSVRRALPEWLANPSFFSSNVNTSLTAITHIEGLDADLIQMLEKQGVQHFFPVQTSVIPAVLSSWERSSPFGKGGFLPQDICVSAPTGSGKTLAYVLPVIELLKRTTVRNLEALVIVPTKDLASQVWKVFNTYVHGSALSVGLANGLKTLKKEQQQLGSNSFLGYSSNVNILVATPGRLVEHISSTDGFSLQFLRFFIIDEADRLLAEPYFGWLDKVYESAYSSGESEACRSSLNTLTPLTTEKIQRPLQKLLFSATLTQNPEKLALLQLFKPRFFTVSKSKVTEINQGETEEFDTHLSTPATLKESMYICNNGGKPLVLLHLLTAQGLDRVLCFTSSVESTHRLYLLVKHFGGIGVQEFSSNLSAGRRQTILNDFKCGQTQIIICSDAMARGLDVPAVKYVISYDPPVSSKTYIHRVGRTARAGKTGTAITFLHDNEVFHFKKMLKSLSKANIRKHSVKDSDLECLMIPYENALGELEAEVTRAKKQMKHR